MPRRGKGSSPPCKWVASLIMRAEYMHLYTCFFSLPLRDMGMYRESPRRSNKVLACGHPLLSSSRPFVWRWPSDRFLRDVLLGVNEWVSKEEHGEGGKGAAGKSLGYSIYALPHGRETPASPRSPGPFSFPLSNPQWCLLALLEYS